MSLIDACKRFAEARSVILNHLTPGSRIAVPHEGVVHVFEHAAGAVLDYDSLPLALAAEPQPTDAKPEAAPAAEPKKRGRPAKAVDPEPATPPASETKPAEPKPPEDKTADAWTADKLRALARQVRDKHGLEAARQVTGKPIDEMTAEERAACAIRLQAALDKPKAAAAVAGDEL